MAYTRTLPHQHTHTHTYRHKNVEFTAVSLSLRAWASFSRSSSRSSCVMSKDLICVKSCRVASANEADSSVEIQRKRRLY